MLFGSIKELVECKNISPENMGVILNFITDNDMTVKKAVFKLV